MASVLDNIEVKEQGFPLQAQSSYSVPSITAQLKGSEPPLGIVGHCTTCGNPIYGRPSLFVGDVPPINRSCSCVPAKTMEMETK